MQVSSMQDRASTGFWGRKLTNNLMMNRWCQMGLFYWFILIITWYDCLCDCMYILPCSGKVTYLYCQFPKPTSISSFGTRVIISIKLMLIIVNRHYIFTLMSHDCLRVIKVNSHSWLFEGHTSLYSCWFLYQYHANISSVFFVQHVLQLDIC